MPVRKSIFGARPQQLDRLLSLGLDTPNAEQENERTTCSEVFREQLGAQIGRYRLLRILGEGGMAIVYLAEQHEPVRREVALKVIKPCMDSARVIARFEAEQQALALMDHPHIARVYDAGVAPSGRPYFVMEHVKGIPITEHCDRYQLTIEERLRLILHVCEAVQHAHQKGVIHRDLKPSNILVAIQDQEVIPKVIDFGVARAMSRPLTERTLFTEQGQLVGTPEYMSPEQADPTNQDIDTRTDVYSLGIVLYELLAGMLPYDPKTFREGGVEHIRKVICEEDPQTPSTRLSKTSVEESTESAQRRRTDVRTLQRRLHGDLDWITLKAMEKDRTRRYPTVDALATDIRNHLDHRPVNAAPPGTFYRLRKLARRHRQALGLAGVAVIVLAVALWGGRNYVRATREHARLVGSEHEQLLRQAQDAYGNGHKDDALAKIDTLLASPHVGRKARLLHARLLLEDQGSGAAVAELEQLLDRPDDVAGQAHFLLANIYYNGDPCAPGGTQEYLQRWQQHREQAEKLISDTASYYFLRARAAYGVKEMLDMLEQALERDKQHYDSLRERAQIYYSQYDYEKVIADAARMIGIRPDNPQGYALSALALQGLGRLDGALKDHNEAIQLAPEDPDLYDARRETYIRFGRYDLSLGDAEKCAELRPQDSSYRHKLFAAYTALGRYDEALREYEHFLSYPSLREHRLGGVPLDLRGAFYLHSSKLVEESVAAGRPWHGPGEPPPTAPYGLMHEIEPFLQDLHTRGKRLVPKGYHPAWSPDGTKLAYSHGLLMASGVAVLDTETGSVELLTTSGQYPEWSPDGRYIACSRNRRIWPTDKFAGLNLRTWRPDGWLSTQAGEVWVVDMATRDFRRVGEGFCPRWGHRSGRLYYTSRRNNTLYSVSLADGDARPIEVLSECGLGPVISPDEQYVADCTPRELRITHLASKKIVATWIAPPSPLGGLNISWSPDSRELSICGRNGSQIGLWIYDMATSGALKVLDGSWMESRWASDGSKMALTLGMFIEIWQAELKPGVSTVASFDSVQTMEEHCRSLMDTPNRWIAVDPDFFHGHHLRAQCALWTDHPQAAEYLQKFEQVLPPYNADDCAHEARWMLDATPELRDRLLPLALLLARKALEKEPENADFLRALGEALYHSDDRENAEVALLRAFDLSIATAEPHDPMTAKVAQLLIQLYESWNRPDEATTWRAKLPDEGRGKE